MRRRRPEHAPSFGTGSQRSIGLLIDSGAGGRQVTVHAKHDADKWLVPGMDVGVRVDPGDADNVEIAWEELPSIEARVAAGDPALVDPIGAEQKVSQARRLPPSDRAERLKDALGAAAAAPAPPGRSSTPTPSLNSARPRSRPPSRGHRIPQRERR